MKFFKTILRIWLAFVSAIGFVAGWIFLAHSPKPAPYVADAATASSVADLPPVPSLDSLIAGNSAPSNTNFTISRPSRVFASSPRLRTGGS